MNLQSALEKNFFYNFKSIIKIFKILSVFSTSSNKSQKYRKLTYFYAAISQIAPKFLTISKSRLY